MVCLEQLAFNLDQMSSKNDDISEILIDSESLDELKKLLTERVKKRRIKLMEDGPFPFRGTGLSGTVSPNITPLNFPFLD